MFEWLMLLLTPTVATYAEPPKKDYVGVVAAEVAYSALLSDAAPVKPKPVDPNCPTCRGTGKVPSGDGQGWSNCPTCQPLHLQMKTPSPAMKLQVKPLAPVKTSACPGGNCPIPRI